VHRSPGHYDFAGIEDLYFAAVYMPPFYTSGRSGSHAHHAHRLDLPARDAQCRRQNRNRNSLELAGGVAEPGPLNLRMYVGPKSIDGLKAVRPPLNSLVQFGLWSFHRRAAVLLPAMAASLHPELRMGIVMITILINMVMFPLK